MENLTPIEQLTTYDLFITKIDENNIIKEYSAYEEKYNMSISCITHLKIECVELGDYANNYKLVNGEMIELTEEEKPIIETPKSETEILTDKISILENENKLLNAQIEALNATNDFHEELIAEMAMLVYA